MDPRTRRDDAPPANRPPSAADPAAGGERRGATRCHGCTKRGARCPFAADAPSKFCLQHDPARADERTAALRARGRNGQRRRVERERAARAKTVAAVALATAGDMRAALERALGDLEGSGAGAVERANATARLVTAAIAVHGQLELEGRLAALAERVEQIDGAERDRLGARPWH